MEKKNGKQVRNWFITLNNPNDIISTLELLRKSVSFFSGQMERGANGTPHLQLVLNFERSVRLTTVTNLLPGCHAEPCLDLTAAIVYCTKLETRIDGPWSYGISPQERQINNWSITVKKAKTLTEEELQDLGVYQYIGVKKALSLVPSPPYSHHDVRGLWYWGLPGVGKSRRAYEDNPNAFRKAQNKWFDGYRYEECIILDDVDMLGGQCLGHYFKIWGDRYPCTGEIKGATLNLNHRQFIVTSNYTPEQIWSQDLILAAAVKRRFRVVEIVNLMLQ